MRVVVGVGLVLVEYGIGNMGFMWMERSKEVGELGRLYLEMCMWGGGGSLGVYGLRGW